jgi:hypothetical protein
MDGGAGVWTTSLSNACGARSSTRPSSTDHQRRVRPRLRPPPLFPKQTHRQGMKLMLLGMGCFQGDSRLKLPGR